MNDLVERDGLYDKKFSDVPFTGEIKSKTDFGQMVDGKKEGHWKYYLLTGQLWEKGNYDNGEEEGIWVRYHPNGQMHFKGDYKNGKKDGSWVEYWSNGQLWSKGAFKNGKEEGPWVPSRSTKSSIVSPQEGNEISDRRINGSVSRDFI